MEPKGHLRIPEVRIPLWWPSLPGNWRAWLPSRGNILFTLLIVGALFWAQSVGAFPSAAPRNGTSTGTIAYQGRLANTSGSPLTGTYNMIFRLYSTGSGGAPLWEEQWTGSNSVRVSDGLFNVMLGSLTPISQSIITGNTTLWLGITVGTDSEMAPRVQLGSVPFAVQALTIADGSVTTAKIADGAVTQVKLGADVSVGVPDGSITTVKIADGAVNQAKAPSLIRSQAGNNFLVQSGRLGCGFSNQNSRTCTVNLPHSYASRDGYTVAIAIDVGGNPDNKLLPSVRNKQSSSFDVRIVTSTGGNLTDSDVAVEWIVYGQ